MSKVSVIVPIYNAEKVLDRCIKSIINQTLCDFELILINDGSKDNSLNICKKYERQDKRIIIIDKNNEGCIATRRKGVEVSKSEYIMFVDADDWIDRRIIEILYNETIESNVDVTVCNMYKIIGDRVFIKKKNKSAYFNEVKVYSEEEIRKDLVVAYIHGHPFPSSLCAKLYKRELLVSSGKYLNSISFFGEDLYYNLEIFLKANRVKILDKSLYFYRAGGNTSKYMSYLFNDIVSGYKIQKEVIEEYYNDTKQQRLNGISIMLLNTFKTCLYNLFNSKHTQREMKELIKMYVSNDCITESVNNEGSIKYFSREFLDAIRNKDTEYLYQLGERMYKVKKPRQMLIDIASRFSII